MEDFKKNRKVILILLVMFGLVLSLALFMNYNNNKSVDNYTLLEPVKDHITFFTVANNVNNFLNKVYQKENNTIDKLLYSKYKDKNSYNKKTISEDLLNYSNKLDINITRMNYIERNNSTIYVIKGNLFDNSEMDNTILVKEDYFIIVILDYDNYTVSFYPTDENYINDVNEINDTKIKKNDVNTYLTGSLITTDNICSMYLNDLVINSSFDGERILGMIDSRMNINSVNELNNYLDNNYDKISTKISSCEAEYLDEFNIYYIYDENGNYYEFTENAVYDYSVYFELK